MLLKYSLINLSPQILWQKFTQFDFRWPPVSIIKFFLKWDKCTAVLAVFKYDYKTMWRILEIPFLSWVIFNKVFSHEKNWVQPCLKLYLKNEWFLICNKKFQNSMMSAWVGLKTDLDTSFLNLENRSFENRFCQ